MNPAEPWPSASGWREFFDLLTDAVVVVDTSARVVLANTAALRLLPCEAGMPVEQFQATLGGAAVRWLRRAASTSRESTAPPVVRLADGRSVGIAWRRLDAQHAAMHLTPQTDQPAAGSAGARRPGPFTLPADRMRETISFLWESPFPALMQGDDFRIVDVNQAFLDFTGETRENVVGHDPLERRPIAEHAAVLAARGRLHAAGATTPEPALIDGSLLDASGRERRYRAARRTLVDETGHHLYLAVLQDTTAEHLARERADRSLRELDDWFDLSPVGMVL
ncbi:MAG: PAS domain S-box protein, partial [Burkholderiales bacterium]